MNKFDYNEVVTIKPKNGILDIRDINELDESEDQKKLIGKTGIILAIGQDYEEKFWLYDVLIDVDNEDEIEFGDHCYCFRETDLESTGEFRERTDMTGITIRVRVNPETGEGDLVDEEDWKKLQ